MHFSKKYSELLLTLPQSLTANAIQYRELKKVINQVVLELASFGLNPALIHELLQPRDSNGPTDEADLHLSTKISGSKPLAVVYEFNNDDTSIQPKLRLSVQLADPPARPEPSSRVAKQQGELNGDTTLLDGCRELPKPGEVTADASTDLLAAFHQLSDGRCDQDQMSNILDSKHLTTKGTTHEVAITLISDATFYRLLSKALNSLSANLLVIQSNFLDTLDDLAKDISLSSRPISSVSSFRPFSASSNPTSIKLPSFPKARFKWNKSDLYHWREIFQIYLESSPFESISEGDRGERTLEESEERLKQFVENVTNRGLRRKLTIKRSRDALDTLFQLNFFILDLKKFQYANAEAARKILKKHAKRTCLPTPSTLSPPATCQPIDPEFSLVSTSLPRVLAQAIGEILLPMIPQIDDYACLICTNIAFKPIRLTCGHLFCVRCLVKMQRRGQGDCPLCRAPTVLIADRCQSFDFDNNNHSEINRDLQRMSIGRY